MVKVSENELKKLIEEEGINSKIESLSKTSDNGVDSKNTEKQQVIVKAEQWLKTHKEINLDIVGVK